RYPTMWFYYFICLSLMLSFHDVMASGIESHLKSLFNKLRGKDQDRLKGLCKDHPRGNCLTVRATGLCEDPAWRNEVNQICPKTCGFCK
ncbi:hypothetical protein V3C99_012586, partial [Haemonchus contortus]